MGYQDQQQTGFISTAQLRNIAKTFKVPIQDQLLQALLQRVKTNETGNVDYREFIGFLNWRDKPITSQKYLPNLAFGIETNTRKGPFECLNHIPYMPFLEAMGFTN